MSWEEILKLQGISAKDQEAHPETTSAQAQESNQQGSLFSRFVAHLGRMFDWVTGPASTEQARGEATVMMASTRSKSDPLF